MLSKSQAKAFFLGGTILFSCLFLYLTVDTMAQIPEQTNSQNLTEEVLRGKEIWDNNNCMGCHTILGEGAYYAPELTKSYVKRGEYWLKLFLKDPEAMYPNDRKMIQYNFTDDQISDVISFLKWISEMDLNGFPADPNIQMASSSDKKPALSNAPEVFTSLCTACHSVAGVGGNVGPALDGVASRYEADFLKKWIFDPPSVKKDTKMPKLPLTIDQIEELVVYLTELK